MESVLDRQKSLNEKLANILKEQGVSKINITTFGNSIASGFSRRRTTIPLLLRNESLNDIMKSKGIIVEKHAFARPQNNNDEHFYEWLINNTTEYDINRMNISDYTRGRSYIDPGYIDRSRMDEYFPLNYRDTKGLQDIIKENNPNIIIYSGGTGALLDNIFRRGKITNFSPKAIDRDITSIHSIMKCIQTANRKQKSNTQVYICGSPNFLGLHVPDIINNRLKKVAKSYANTIYVSPIVAKFFYKDLHDNRIRPDLHYDEEEYDKLNNRILESVIDNYSITQSMINTDRDLYTRSSNIEIYEKNNFKDDDLMQALIERVINDDTSKLTDKEKLLYYKRALKYLIDRYPYDFYFIGKDNIKEAISNSKKLIKK